MGISFLKKARERLPQAKDLRFMLHDHLHVVDPHRGVSRVHASELTREERPFCPRFYALADATQAKLPGSWLSTSENVTFMLGRVLQDAVVTWFAEMGRAVGHWRCLSCRVTQHFQPRPIKCPECGCRRFDPEEVRFESAQSGASCGVDMLLDVGKAKLLPVEIKTMNADEFKKLEAPLAEHRLRTTLYLRIIAESAHHWRNRVDTSQAEVLYVSKGGYGVSDPQLKEWGLYEHYSPFKRYSVKRDDKLVQTCCSLARVVKDYRDGAIGMPAGICPTSMSKRAKQCPLAKECFSGDHPAVHEWQEIPF